MIILDTNVISEIFRPAPEPRVIGWLERLSGEVAITAVTVGELLAGVSLLPDGRRRSTLSDRIAAALEPYRDDGAILPFDDRAASSYAEIVATRRREGRPIHTADAQIAAICRVHSATCATRNLADFEGVGIELLDPWAA